MPRILIIEDEPGVQMTLEDRLQAEGYTTEVRGDGISGQKEAETGNYDLMILDIMLPGRDGFAVCQNLRNKDINTPVLMLTARNTNLDSIMGLRQGADDYMAKPFDMGLLLARIEALLRRSALTAQSSGNSETFFRFGEFSFDLKKGNLMMGDLLIHLHAKEFRLLEYLVKHSGELLSRDKILDEVWGYESETTTRTVDVHIAKLRQKLNESDLPRHIMTVRGQGYRFST
ncbi:MULTISPECIES: response regulator transcription factor [unclassified Oceanispirochaeta]|uniref:response regulator transcription factor n=1 Tax=unclassified Oceanispirochaeta TaxID=2635722 RepID=UPI000E08E03E|nr:MULTISPECIES: response regulator transcription factor [unclassified Oceanispirochaeta]MBF9018176.1 response regulator transcription factor [Oceanispirochaeta sp. M2]NPD74641.1 response regulator transcription factor [Oceanispirochaeta sp. M1]RDG29511.1 DNA-binding response regulator [Oceanispirochaeta sp. M1]